MAAPVHVTHPQRKKSVPGQTSDWGRHADGNWWSTFGALFMLIFCPLFAGFAVFVCVSFDGSIGALLNHTWHTLHLPANNADTPMTESAWPSFTTRGLTIYLTWIMAQFILAIVVPGRREYGQLTPAGHLLAYKVNGLRCWWISHIFILACGSLGIFRLAALYDEWHNIFLYANILGYALTVFAYIKACTFPSHPNDCKFSGSFLYDLFMGVELNPRFGDWFDFKLFFNGRPGICAWTLINIAFMHKQYELHGYVTNSMIVVNILQALYVLDFFWNEGWYLRTIDIAHDHFGFYLAWGDSVWLPFTYTIQAFYLVKNPVNLPTWAAVALLIAGLSGYAIFRAVNEQKDRFRAKKADCLIWGKKPTYIMATFNCGSGETRHSYLLTSGFWGLSRHFNYLGDLILSFSFCAACGFTHLLPHFYIIYMFLLLVHRCYRDDDRCRAKYGEYWEQYCKQVPYKILPYVF